ncbi:hypothetical protein ACIBBE_42840 [Streptomyces sp. NPDC051644]|uniref:hypothetical protein n=1 Tax=Streptomyces sp. NPDC051644 TaxID=3365666 RepID=UPI0037A5E339
MSTDESPEVHQANEVDQAKARLAEFAGRLTVLDAGPVPSATRATRQHWHYLCRRKTLLHGLVEDTHALAAAHKSADDASAGLALTELTEHYQHLYALAARAVEIHKGAIAQVIKRSAAYRGTT